MEGEHKEIEVIFDKIRDYGYSNINKLIEYYESRVIIISL